MTQPVAVPTSTETSKAHTNSDVDSAVTAQHHTLGTKHNQSAPGDHTHDGKNSRKIGKGINAGFPTTAAAAYSQAQMQNVIDALRALGLGT
jgi:hypothetical protein